MAEQREYLDKEGLDRLVDNIDNKYATNEQVENIESNQAEDLAKITELQGKLNGIDNLQEELDKIPTLQDRVNGTEKNYIYSDPTKAGKGAIAAARYRANDKGKLTAQYKYWGDSDFNYNTEFPQATPTTDGVMSAEDKKALDKINNDFDTLEFTVGTLNEGLGHANNDITKLGERITTLDDELANAVIGEEVIDEDVFPDIDKYTKEELAEELASVSPTIQNIKHNYARKDGAYEGMLVGTALNLQGQDESVNSSMYRTAGGTADIASGLAEVVGIRGESVAWNQLCEQEWKPRISNGILTDNDTITLVKKEDNSNNQVFCNINLVQNHVYALFMTFVDSSNGVIANLCTTSYTGLQRLTTNNLNKKINIIFKNESAEARRLVISSYTYGKYEIETPLLQFNKNAMVFDLTLIYGAGNEPSTPEQFEADYQRWFGKPLTYEEYDEGSIRNVKAEGIKTVGFNLCNNGKAEVFAGHQYQITGKYTSIGINGETITPNGDGKFTPNTQGTLEIVGSDNTTCVHLVWSGKRDGEYEPHWEETKSLPITSLKGKLNGEGQEVVIFPDGMKKAGNIYDEIKVEGGVVKAIKRVGSVDLGTLNYQNSSSGSVYESLYKTQITNLKKVGFSTEKSQLLVSTLYLIDTQANFQVVDKAIMGSYNADGELLIKNTDFVRDPQSLKASLSGVILYYELATPEEYILSEDILPLVYKVDDFGTEQVISPENTIAPSLIVKYGMNAVDTLRRLPQNYISVESMDNFLSRLSAAMNGTWTKVWNESTGRYDFSFVANIQNDVE